jgi:hypothetical protein
MKAHLRIRRLAWVIAFVGASASTSAQADIYTWVDSSGNLNMSNLAPPEGARVTNVFREDPALHASAEAARAAAQREELRALSDRVTQLERDLDAAKHQESPPIAYAPAMPAPAPAPYPSVVAQAIVAPMTPTYGNCADPWASCFSPGYFGFYPGGVVILSAPPPHRIHPVRRGQRVRMPPSAHALPTPVGALPDPVNLFPGSHRR